MFTDKLRARIRPFGMVALVSCSSFAVCCGSAVSKPDTLYVESASEFTEAPKQIEPQRTGEPTCCIRFLTCEERLHPDPNKPRLTSAEEIEHPYPDDAVDNPVLLQDRFAVLRFENTTGRPIHAYLHGWETIEEDADTLRAVQEMERTVIMKRTFRNERARHHALKSLDSPRHAHPAEGAFAASAELQSSDGEVFRVPEKYMAGCLQFNNSPPTPAEFRSHQYPTRTVQTGETIELKVSILGILRNRETGLKPGAYTVRVMVTYAEAPSGETKRLTSEPVAVTVTEEHIKAAEAYWEATKN
jgi:hypothetical protein